jgi:hypothetical protein
MRALLDLMRKNTAAVQHILPACNSLLAVAVQNFKILDPKHGEKALIKAVQVEQANLRRGYITCN